MINKRLLVLLGVVFYTILSYGQYGTIKGFVYDKDNGEPCIFASVYLKDTRLGAATDINGYFSINRVPVGTQTLVITYVGYDSIAREIPITDDGLFSETFYMTKSSFLLQETVVSAEREEMRTQVRTSVVKVTPMQIQRLPTVGSEPDLAQYLQVLPGVIFTGDQGGQLYIRGGAPIHNLVTLDGMVIYNPFHSIGLFSVFDSDILQSVDVYTGGFNAEYGGRISSVMDIRMREGNKKRFAGKFSASTFGSKLLLEGPLKKFKQGENTISYVVSAKTSFLEQSSKLLYKYIDEDGLPFNYTDLYGKLSFVNPGGSKFNVFGFKFNDNVNYQEISNLEWDSYGIGGNFVAVPIGSTVMIKANMSYTDYQIHIQDVNNTPRQSRINGYNLGLDFVYFLGKNEFVWGIETLGFTTDFEFSNSVGREIRQNDHTTELAAYGKYKHNFGSLLIEPSMRIHYYASIGDISPEPRLGIKYNFNEIFRIKFAGGLYSQNLIAANSDQDVVNLFYGFLSGSNNIPSTFNGEPVTHSLQKSQHAIAGFELDITNKLNLNVEAYYKNFSQLTNINRNKLYDDVSQNLDKPDYLKKDFVIETGKAYGIDFLLKYDSRKVYLWLVYSLGYVKRFDGIKEYAPHFDRRHNVNFVGTYKFGKELSWNISARWNLGSGFPFTPTAGYYEQMPFYADINLNYWQENGNLGILYGDVNSARLPYYHRFDLTLKKIISLGQNSSLELTASVTNIYNRENIFYFDRVDHARVNQLPIMPSFGLSLTF